MHTEAAGFHVHLIRAIAVKIHLNLICGIGFLPGSGPAFGDVAAVVCGGHAGFGFEDFGEVIGGGKAQGFCYLGKGGVGACDPALGLPHFQIHKILHDAHPGLPAEFPGQRGLAHQESPADILHADLLFQILRQIPLHLVHQCDLIDTPAGLLRFVHQEDCDTHPKFKNSKTVLTTEYIKNAYNKCIQDNDFL